MLQKIIEDQRACFLEGKTSSIKKRLELLKGIKALLKFHEKEIADAVYKDFKKSYFEVRENELGIVYSEISLAIKKLRKWSRPKKARTSLPNLPGTTRLLPIPYGNTLIIAPWNYPVQLALTPLVSAIAAGNTVILKPSELTPHTSNLLAALFNKAFPPEIIYVQTGGVKETGELLENRFDKIFFTGSPAVGKIVMQAAVKHLTPVTLELGGKNPTIVMPDCNIKMTAKRLVWGKYHNSGQACVSPDHIYVHASIKEKLLEEIKKQIIEIFGEKPEESKALPRIVNSRHFERLKGLIDQDKLYHGGNSINEELFIEPGVLVDVDLNDAVMQEEVFGPIMPIIEYTELEELKGQLKEMESPLALYIFTKNKKIAWELQKSIPSGGGMINDTVVHFVNINSPFGGLGNSGMGNYHGKYGFECFTHFKTVLSKPYWFELWVKYPPYTNFKLKLIKLILK